MTINAKDVLLPVNPESVDQNIEEEALLDDMAALAVEAGDWRDHLPFDVVLCYCDTSDVSTEFQAHVDECNYCQRFIPTNRTNR